MKHLGGILVAHTCALDTGFTLDEASRESMRLVIRLVIPLSIRLIMVCLLRRGRENIGVQMRRMLKPD